MQPLVSGSSVAYDSLQLVWFEVRHVFDLVVWALIVGLAGAAGCWCSGYAVRAAWLRAGPPRRRRPASGARPGVTPGDRPQDGPDDDVAREARRGVCEIEAFLASLDAGPGRAPKDPGRRRPDADAA